MFKQKLDGNRDNVTSQSRKFYEKYPFPGTRPLDRDGLIFLRNINSSIESLVKKGVRPSILDAGCGTGNTIIHLAENNKKLKFVGFDNSKTSLIKAVTLSESKNLSNVIFKKWNLRVSLPYKNYFEIIYCLGVLHHTADPIAVLKNLYHALKDDGELYLWIYSKYGRYKHSLNMRLLSMLLKNKSREIDELNFTKEFIFNTKNITPLNDLVQTYSEDPSLNEMFSDPIWIADQFLNPNEILLSMEELIELSHLCGFEISKVLGINPEISNYLSSDQLCSSFHNLTKTKQLIALDLLLKPPRHFVILRKTKRR